MPLLRGGPSFVRLRVMEAPGLGPDWVESLPSGLRAHAFRPLDRSSGDEARSAGFVELHDPGSVELSPSRVLFGDDALFSWRIDQVRVPAELVRSALSEWAAAFEETHRRKPTKRERAEQKEHAARSLRRQALVSTRVHDVRWRLDTRELQVWALAPKVVEEITVALEAALGVHVRPLGPGPRWEEAGLPVEGLLPTAALFGAEVDAEGERTGLGGVRG